VRCAGVAQTSTKRNDCDRRLHDDSMSNSNTRKEVGWREEEKAEEEE
jgi:hypothetical protein